MKCLLCFVLLLYSANAFSQSNDSLRVVTGFFEFGLNFSLLRSDNPFGRQGPLGPYINIGLRTNKTNQTNYAMLLTANSFGSTVIFGLTPRVYFKTRPEKTKELYLGLRYGFNNFFKSNIGIESGYELSNGLAFHVGLDSYKSSGIWNRRFTIGTRASGKNAFYTLVSVLGAYAILVIPAIGRSR